MRIIVEFAVAGRDTRVNDRHVELKTKPFSQQFNANRPACDEERVTIIFEHRTEYHLFASRKHAGPMILLHCFHEVINPWLCCKYGQRSYEISILCLARAWLLFVRTKTINRNTAQAINNNHVTWIGTKPLDNFISRIHAICSGCQFVYHGRINFHPIRVFTFQRCCAVFFSKVNKISSFQKCKLFDSNKILVSINHTVGYKQVIAIEVLCQCSKSMKPINPCRHLHNTSHWHWNDESDDANGKANQWHCLMLWCEIRWYMTVLGARYKSIGLRLEMGVDPKTKSHTLLITNKKVRHNGIAASE